MRCRHRFPRLLLVALVVGAVAWWWQRSRSRAEAETAPEAAPESSAANFGAAPGAEPAPAPNPVATDEVGAAPGAEPAPAPNPVADQAAEVAQWVLPVDGGCPPGYPVKANDNSGIYHLPGGRSYDRTVAERCYATAEAAEADGYRQSKT